MKRFGVGVLGATGMVGQRFLAMLEGHPWFDVRFVAASERSAGKRYAEAASWVLDTPMPDAFADLPVRNPSPDEPGAEECQVVFSALPSEVAGPVEEAFARAGHVVATNAASHRMDPDVPILVPEVNLGHLAALGPQREGRGWEGALVSNPNCTSTGLVVALKPLMALGLSRAAVTTLQALSGAGYPGVPSLAITDNVVPFIAGEERKVAAETRKMLGSYSRDGGFADAPLEVSATCTRVPVLDGHLESVFAALEGTPDDAMRAFRGFEDPVAGLRLPSSPKRPLELLDAEDRPQPRRDRMRGGGMTVSVGRVRPDPALGVKFLLLVHNTIRGAAGASILNAELMVRKRIVKG
jgi:aspartate-semialdehyde dehydrogenase